MRSTLDDREVLGQPFWRVLKVRCVEEEDDMVETVC